MAWEPAPVFFDSLLVRGHGSDQIVALNNDTHRREPKNKKTDRELDYDLDILERRAARPPHGAGHSHNAPTCCLTSRTSTIRRYVVTSAFYSNYQIFNEIPFPLKT